MARYPATRSCPPSRSAWPYLLAAAVLVFVGLSAVSHSKSDRPAAWNPSSWTTSPNEHLAKLDSWSAYPKDPADSLAYRNHLELTTSPPEQITHSPTLGFSNIYVLSLPHRHDRRDDIRKIARALGVRVSFVDAAIKDEPFFQWIAERVVETRARRVSLMAATRRVKPSMIGGLGIDGVWVSPTQDKEGRVPFPPFVDPKYRAGENWVTVLERAHSNGNLSNLVPSSPHVNVTEILWDQREWLPLRQVNEGVMSTFWGHTRVLKTIIENGDESALVLEDDVDIEWDMERLWSRIARKLPENWETVHLGSCWGHELLQPQYLHPLLHKSTAPKCLHGWAVSKRGATHLLSLLNNPWSAYSTAIDVAVPTFINRHLLRSFSVEPPLIIQRKDGPSDLQGGNGSKWRGVLRDSTLERIWRDEGIEVVDEVWDPKHLDPATTFREARPVDC